MVCPKCGFMMDAFAIECPRCKRMGQNASQTGQQKQGVTPEGSNLSNKAAEATPPTSMPSQPVTLPIPSGNSGKISKEGVVAIIAITLTIAAFIYGLTYRSPYMTYDDNRPSTNDNSQSVTANSSSESEAMKVSQQIKATPDVTTLEEFMVQTPDIQSEKSLVGEYRIFKWTFADGSQLIATFIPKGGEGQGLIFYSIEVR